MTTAATPLVAFSMSNEIQVAPNRSATSSTAPMASKKCSMRLRICKSAFPPSSVWFSPSSYSLSHAIVRQTWHNIGRSMDLSILSLPK